MISCKKTRILPYVPLRTMGGELSFARFWRKPTPKECALCLSAGARLLAPFRGRSLYEGQRRKYREMSFLEKWWVEANIICPFNTFAKMKKLCPPQVPQYLIDKYLRYKKGGSEKTQLARAQSAQNERVSVLRIMLLPDVAWLLTYFPWAFQRSYKSLLMCAKELFNKDKSHSLYWLCGWIYNI